MILSTLLSSWIHNHFSLYPVITSIMMYWFLHILFSHQFTSWQYEDHYSNTLILLSISTLLIIVITVPNPSPFTILIMVTIYIIFSNNNIFIFYTFFELALIPTLLLIFSLGKQPERLQAGLYFFLYTTTASLPLLICFIYLPPSPLMSSILTLNSHLPFNTLFILAFLVKMPMFGLHLWLPKAHVEAPLQGSMILAAILLKLGGYGLIRFTPFLTFPPSSFLIPCAMVGSTLTSLICLHQKDMKALIAYSSIAHMGLVIMTCFSLSPESSTSSLPLLISHAFSSSLLFFISNTLYSQHHSRNLLLFKGLINSSPSITFWMFSASAINFSVPPTANFLSECMITITSISSFPSSLIPIFITSMSTTSFSIIFFVSINHSNNFMFNPHSQTPPHFHLTSASHILPLLLLALKPSTMC